MHFALSNRSALSGSFVANQMQDRQFPFCHCMPFKRFCGSDSGPDMIPTQRMGPKNYLSSENKTNFMKSAQKGTQKSAKSTTETSKAFTEEERGAIRDRVQEMKAGNGEGESAVLAKIAEMREPDRTRAKQLHASIRESGPGPRP